jgi:MerR family transcriptional regulator/heat shock protein HspR
MMMYSEDTEPRYVISVAAKMLGVQTYTLRYYEKAGIITPHRAGRTRLYSERDIALLKKVKTLMDDMGVNLAGVDVILRLMAKVTEMQSRMELMEKELKRLRGETK